MELIRVRDGGAQLLYDWASLGVGAQSQEREQLARSNVLLECQAGEGSPVPIRLLRGELQRPLPWRPSLPENKNQALPLSIGYCVLT